MNLVYVLIPSSEFNALDISVRNEILNASTSYLFSDTPVYVLSGIEYRYLEVYEELAHITYLMNYRFLSDSQSIAIVRSGIYNPLA